MIKRSDIGSEVSIRGEKFIVIDFREQTCVDDFGFGPVWQSYSATLKDLESGEIIEIDWED